MSRVPLLSGSRTVFVPVGEDDEIVRPPPPPEQVVDARAAARDALRFPLQGAALSALVPRGGRATIVVESPALPLPGSTRDPRQDALAAAIDELARAGIPDGRQTLLLAGGLGGRRTVRDAVRLVLPQSRVRSFRGRVLVHDAEAPDLVSLPTGVRVHPALVECDLVVTVTAAETILHGGAGALLAAADAETVRRTAGAGSLLEASGADEWALAVDTEAALATRVPLVGVSLVLDLPRLGDRARRDMDESAGGVRMMNALPAVLRRAFLERRPPSVAHAEALLRGISLRGTSISEPVDALVVGVPWHGPHLPREAANPVTAAACSLGLALRLRRDAFPIRPNGTLVLLHSLRRAFFQAPYASMFQALRAAKDPSDLAKAEEDAAGDERALAAYRSGEACHPLLPYADWAGCQPALARLGQVVVAGCRDAPAARALGFVPSHGIGSALEMARGVAGGSARVGILLAPPYAPLIVGET